MSFEFFTELANDPIVWFIATMVSIIGVMLPYRDEQNRFLLRLLFSIALAGNAHMWGYSLAKILYGA